MCELFPFGFSVYSSIPVWKVRNPRRTDSGFLQEKWKIKDQCFCAATGTTVDVFRNGPRDHMIQILVSNSLWISFGDNSK